MDCLRCRGIAPPLEAHGPGSCTQGRWCPLCTELLSIAETSQLTNHSFCGMVPQQDRSFADSLANRANRNHCCRSWFGPCTDGLRQVRIFDHLNGAAIALEASSAEARNKWQRQCN